MSKMLITLVVTNTIWAALAVAQSEPPVTLLGASGTPLEVSVGILMVGGVDSEGTVRQIQMDSRGYVICSQESASAHLPYRTESGIAPPGSIVQQSTNVAIGRPWNPQVDQDGFIVCSNEKPKDRP